MKLLDFCREFSDEPRAADLKSPRVMHLLTRRKDSAPEKVALKVCEELSDCAQMDVEFLFVSGSIIDGLCRLHNILYKMGNYDVIHSHGLIPDIFVTLFCSRNRRVTTLHVDPRLDLRNKTKSTFIYVCAYWLWRLVLLRFACSISVNQYISSIYFNHCANWKHVVVRNSFNPERVLGNAVDIDLVTKLKDFKSENVHIICATAVLSRLKRIDFLISSLPRIRKFLNIGVVVIGTGPEEMNLKKLVMTLGIAKNVLFLGQIVHPILYYQYIDSFYTGSTSEGSSLAVIEALSIGLPVIANDIPANVEIFGSNNPLLFSDNDSDSLLRALQHCDKNSAKLRQQSHEYYKKYFTTETFANGYRHLYDSMIDNSRT